MEKRMRRRILIVENDHRVFSEIAASIYALHTGKPYIRQVDEVHKGFLFNWKRMRIWYQIHRKEGLYITAAQDAKSAIKKMNEEEYDLITIGKVLADNTDGIEVINHIHRKATTGWFTKKKDLLEKVIIISDNNSFHEAAKKKGIHKSIQKSLLFYPTRVGTPVREVEMYLGRKLEVELAD